MSKNFCVTYNPKWTNMNTNIINVGKFTPVNKAPVKPTFGYVQPWNGNCPKCTLKTGCENMPCQTHNIKTEIYNGIESECNKWIEMAGAEALKSVQHGGGPFGAVIVRVDNETGKEIEYWVNHNHVEEWNDPTAHAEVSTIRVACQDLAKRFGRHIFDLGNIIDKNGKKSHCVIYSSAEPCPMCYAAINWARMPYLVFAATRYDAAQQGIDFSDEAIYADLVVPYRERKNITVRQSACKNSLDAFNQWKRMQKINY